VRLPSGSEPAFEHEQENPMKSITFAKHASLVTLLAFGCAGLAAAQSQQDRRLAQLADAEGCVYPEVPDIPDAADATMEQMVATAGAVQAYIEESNTLLECLDGIEKNEDLPAEDRQLARDGYNAEVTNQETLAESWNVQRTRFLEMQQQ
jgi:hypothetical protein